MKRVCFTILAVLLTASPSFAGGLVRNENFIVFVPVDSSPDAGREFGRAVMAQAESYRKQIAEEWLGEELPPSVGRTVINVNLSDTEDKGLTWAKDHPDRTLHNLYLSTSAHGALGGTLAHEMAHVVLATQFPAPRRLPAWVEEGIASRYDDEQRASVRRRIVKWFASSGNWPQLERILNAENISADDRSAYAAAAGLTDFFLARGDKQQFLEFAAAAGARGWDQALRQHYGIADVRELQGAWQVWSSGLRAAVD